MESNQLFHDRYYLEKLLGRGNFSEVWLAKDMETNLEVALKIYAPATGLDDQGLNVLSREFAIVINANHKNLLKPLYYASSKDRRPYLILPFCENGSILKDVGKFSENQAWRLIRDVASGLAFLHAMKPTIVHQDIKPDNIMLSNDGETYMITDFGVSTHVRSALRKSASAAFVSAGTTAYMAPERFSKDNTPIMANDIYSLGVTVYEMLTGNAPFGDSGGLLQKRGAEIPDLKGDYSEALKKVINLCLQEEPWDRPTAAQLEEIANTYINGGGILTNSVNHKMQELLRQLQLSDEEERSFTIPYKWVGIGAAALVLIIGLFFILRLGGNSNKELSDLVVSDTIQQVKKDSLQIVTNHYFNSALGVSSYTGPIDKDEKPHGIGEASFSDGRLYKGPFIHGKMEGEKAYFRYDNGDYFEGSFVNNSFSEGRYSMKSDGSYFVGKFKKGQPDDGIWYDKKGNKI